MAEIGCNNNDHVANKNEKSYLWTNDVGITKFHKKVNRQNPTKEKFVSRHNIILSCMEEGWKPLQPKMNEGTAGDGGVSDVANIKGPQSLVCIKNTCGSLNVVTYMFCLCKIHF